MPLTIITNEPPSELGRGLVRLRGEVAYDGTDFSGWGIQVSQRTVQGEVQSAISTAFRLHAPVTVTVAGRTDAGVHARGQVIHVDIPESAIHDLSKTLYSINALLPDDIRMHALTVAPEGFDARFSAIARRYSYAIADGPFDPLMRHFVVAHWRRLDEHAMNEASEKLLGLHDFTSFCKKTDFGTAIRTLQEFSWVRTDVGVTAHLKADAFCHSMVRSLIGALVPVGEHKQPVTFPREVLERRTRGSDVVTMPGHGLVLEQVYYPEDSQLAARAEETRALRDISEVDPL